MKHKLTKIGNPPYFGQFEAPPSLFCTRPLYPQGVLKVPVGVNNNLLAPVMGAPGAPPGVPRCPRVLEKKFKNSENYIENLHASKYPKFKL